MSRVLVTVVIPVYNEANHIKGVLESVLANDLASDTYEIIVVDGGSSDGTRSIVRRYAQQHPQIVLLDNPQKTVPFAMNIGIRAARGELIVRIDGHAEIEPTFLRNCVEELRAHPECGCVGGYIENGGTGAVGAAIARAVSSPFGSGNARYRLGGNYEGYVDTLLFGAYRRAVLEEVGLFDEELTRNQDDELHFRIQRAGYKIWISRSIRSRYFVRNSLGKLWTQYYQYGYWKVLVNRKHGNLTSLRQLVPAAFVLFLMVVFLLLPIVPVAGLLLLLTLAAWLICSLAAALPKAGGPVQAFYTVLAFATMHFAYGLGYLEGLVWFLLFRSSPRPGNAQVSR